MSRPQFQVRIKYCDGMRDSHPWPNGFDEVHRKLWTELGDQKNNYRDFKIVPVTDTAQNTKRIDDIGGELCQFNLVNDSYQIAARDGTVLIQCPVCQSYLRHRALRKYEMTEFTKQSKRWCSAMLIFKKITRTGEFTRQLMRRLGHAS